MKTADGIIGVIDIQSDEPEAFTQDDIAIVQVMADQLATAIQRDPAARTGADTIDQLEQSQRSFTAQSWQIFDRGGRQNIGYKFDNVHLEALKSVPEETQAALRKSQLLSTDGPAFPSNRVQRANNRRAYSVARSDPWDREPSLPIGASAGGDSEHDPASC